MSCLYDNHLWHVIYNHLCHVLCLYNHLCHVLCLYNHLCHDNHL